MKSLISLWMDECQIPGRVSKVEGERDGGRGHCSFRRGQMVTAALEPSRTHTHRHTQAHTQAHRHARAELPQLVCTADFVFGGRSESYFFNFPLICLRSSPSARAGRKFLVRVIVVWITSTLFCVALHESRGRKSVDRRLFLKFLRAAPWQGARHCRWK